MKGFAGEVAFGGTRSPIGLDRLAAALAPLGGQTGRWDAGACGIVAQPVVLRRPEDGAQIVTAAAARLDDRPSLIAQLDLAPAEAEALSDAGLLAHAFVRWGDGLADRVLGDWVCAVWDCARQRLWLGRDAAGNTGLFYWHDGDRLVFSTNLPALLAHPWVPVRPNARRFARQITVIHDPADPMSTVYERVQTLPGGHAVSVDAGGATVTRWWRPEALPRWTGADDDEFLARFMGIYRQAVEDRMTTRAGAVGIMLSGGLDSGSVAALAAPHARANGLALRAYTSVPAYSPAGASASRDGDETAVAGATVAHLGLGDRWTQVRCEAEPIVATLEHIQRVHARPLHAAANYYWIRGILRQAGHDGVGALLTGQGGNLTVSWSGSGGLRGRVNAWRTWLRALRQPRPGHEDPRLSPIHPAWARALSLSYPHLLPSEQRALLSEGRLCRLGSASLGSLWMECSTVAGVDVRDPTRDRRIIECCWSSGAAVHRPGADSAAVPGTAAGCGARQPSPGASGGRPRTQNCRRAPGGLVSHRPPFTPSSGPGVARSSAPAADP